MMHASATTALAMITLMGVGALNAAESHPSGSRLKVTVSEPWTATFQPNVPFDREKRGPPRCWLPYLVRSQKGTLILTHSVWEDAYFPPEPVEPDMMLRSTDRGRTWVRQGVMPFRITLGGTLRDGTLIQLSYIAEQRKPDLWAMRVRRSTDDGKTWRIEENVPIRIANAVRLPDPKLNQGLYLDHSLVELTDGTLLASAYGHFTGDTKWRSLVLHSRDRGRSWDYRATVAYDPSAPGEGYNEISIAKVRDGRLLAIMRVASGQPMRQCYSSDDGVTWTKPVETKARSVEPTLLPMSNGVLACSHGRPGAWIMFSPGGNGDDWETPIQVDPFAGPAWFYTSIVEIQPGVLLYAFDQQGVQDPKTKQSINAIRLRTVRVERRIAVASDDRIASRSEIFRQRDEAGSGPIRRIEDLEGHNLAGLRLGRAHCGSH